MKNKTEHYLVIIEGDVEPTVIGPYKNDDERISAAKSHREDDPDKQDGLFKLEIKNGKPEMYPFLASDLEDEENNLKGEDNMEKKYNTTIDLGIGTPEGFRLLAEQKLELVKIVHNGAPDILNGLISFIDHIQDTCADKNDVPEHIVFPLRVEDKNSIPLKNGDKVKVDVPTNEDEWYSEFEGVITEIKSSGREILAVVQQNEDSPPYEVSLDKLERI